MKCNVCSQVFEGMLQLSQHYMSSHSHHGPTSGDVQRMEGAAATRVAKDEPLRLNLLPREVVLVRPQEDSDVPRVIDVRLPAGDSTTLVKYVLVDVLPPEVKTVLFEYFSSDGQDFSGLRAAAVALTESIDSRSVPAEETDVQTQTSEVVESPPAEDGHQDGASE